MSGVSADALATIAARLRAARRITILTGAGVSAASGVPTFRGAGGLWRNARAEDLATAAAFHRDPVFVWEWYDWRRQLVAGCQPNAAHQVIARWSQQPRCRVITQNVDDLHVRAGTRDLVRLHGSLWELRCAGGVSDGRAPRFGAENERGCGAPRWRDERAPLPTLPPRCPHCGALARPAVVWFGESLAAEDVAAAGQACTCDVFLAIGTSAVVYPAAGFVQDARRRGAYTAEINPDATPASAQVDLVLAGAAEELLPAIDALL